MSKIAYVIDSTSILTDERYKDIRIEVVSLGVSVDEVDTKEVDMSDETMVANLDKNIKSSSPSPKDFQDAYNKLIYEGYEDIVVLPLSSGISSTINSAKIAKDGLEDYFAEHIHIVDTLVCNYALVNAIDSCLDYMLNPETDVNEIVAKLEEACRNSTTMFTITDLKHLVRGGRIGKVTGFIGGVLKIKPVVAIKKDGKLDLVHIKRKDSDIMKLFEEKFKEYKEKFKNVFCRIISLTRDNEHDQLVNKVKQNYSTFHLSDIKRVGPVFLVHLGNQGYGITITGNNW